ncbi:MAG: succinylglutamate desuccinylase/aspartoacylase family protein [Saprospiraceae bacterium]|jgi:predicted deacylase|nr:succinylglutamate desuccinylase/aspartoacylase family protein [Saprospiraceae bacterium]
MNAKDIINLNGQDFPLGSSGLVRINAGKLPSGNRISIFTYIFRSKNPGPTVLFTGGMHGDEINGVEIIRRSIEQGVFANLKCGTVIAIPLLNIFGFINFSRDVPDGKDVNRSFPGSLSGSLASRIARIITKKVLIHIDFGIDFHTGGKDLWNFPQVRFSPKHPEAKSLALKSAFGTLIEKAVVSKSFRKIARDSKIPILVFEGGEALRLEGFIIGRGMSLIKNVLINSNMIDGELNKTLINHVFKKTGWERAPEGGMVNYIRQAGSFIKKGEMLAVIHDPFALKEIRMYASKDAFIIGHNNAPVVNIGDGMIHIAYEEEKFAYLPSK